MDFFSHIIWTFLLYRLLGFASGDATQAAFFGVVPDIAFALAIFLLSSGHFLRLRNLKGVREKYFKQVLVVYRYSHSWVSFAVFFAVSSLYLGKPYWPALGWALHILLDLWTHLGSPVEPQKPFFPLSQYAVKGWIWWRNPYFLALNWAAIVSLYFSGMLR